MWNLFKKPKPESGNPSDTNPEATAEQPKWHETLVLICEKCGKKMNAEKNPSHTLKDQVKRTLVSQGCWGGVRVSTSSCLDICPEGKIAVAFTGDQPGQPTVAYTLDPEKDREWLVQKIKNRAKI